MAIVPRPLKADSASTAAIEPNASQGYGASITGVGPAKATGVSVAVPRE